MVKLESTASRLTIPSFTLPFLKSPRRRSLLRPRLSRHALPTLQKPNSQSWFSESRTCTCKSSVAEAARRRSDAGPQPAGKMDDGCEEDILPPRSLRGGEAVITDWPLRWQAVTLRLHSGELGGAQIMGCAEVAWTFYCFVLFFYIYLSMFICCARARMCVCVYVCV